MPVAGAALGSTAIDLFHAEEALGLRREKDGRFVWRLSTELATAFREEIVELAADDQASGSAVLESGQAGEIPVKVSHGEFTDDFLAPGSTIPA